ncbi:unnamed protein product, partial [marine sediment metagenome]
VLFPRPDHTKALGEFAASVGATETQNKAPSEQKTMVTTTQTAENPPEIKPQEAPKVHLAEPQPGGLSTEETVAYENREIAKNLVQVEKHYAQKLRINGIPCDCGTGRHLLAIEGGCENAISMVDNPDVYYRVIEWCKEVGPKSTDESAKSGLYDEEYPTFSHQARDFRKEIIGSLDPKALFPQKPGEPEGTRILPVVSEEEKEEIRQKAHEKIEQVLSPMEAERVPAVIPTEPRPRRETDLEYLADSPEHLA